MSTNWHNRTERQEVWVRNGHAQMHANGFWRLFQRTFIHLWGNLKILCSIGFFMSSQLASWKLLECSNDNLLLTPSFAQIRVKSSFTEWSIPPCLKFSPYWFSNRNACCFLWTSILDCPGTSINVEILGLQDYVVDTRRDFSSNPAVRKQIW